MPRSIPPPPCFLLVARGNQVSCHLAVYSDGSYGIEKGLFYSYPCICAAGEWSIEQNLAVDSFAQQKMADTEKELVEERDAVKHLLP